MLWRPFAGRWKAFAGVTSAIAVPAYAGIPVTHRGACAAMAIVTGHEDPEKPGSLLGWHELARGVDTLVFLMGVKNLPHVVEQLLSNGRPPETPVALIRWGTYPRQETLTGTLATIQSKVAGRQFDPPAIIVVGEVVRLRERLRWFVPHMIGRAVSREIRRTIAGT